MSRLNFEKSCSVQVKLTGAAQVAMNTTAEQTFTVNGLKLGDIVVALNKPALQAGLGIVNARVSADNTLAITFVNATGSGITPTATEAYNCYFIRPYNKLGGVDALSGNAIFS